MIINDWQSTKNNLSKCTLCHTTGQGSLLDRHARPLFGQFQPRPRSLLFVLEAPNADDTHNPSKGYITVGGDTDPSGTFLNELHETTFPTHSRGIQIVNSVLCLPAARRSSRPVSAAQRKLCSMNLRAQIETLDPAVVAPLGGEPLRALRLLDWHPYVSIGAGVSRPVRWLQRWLFPLYHTSLQARHGPHGRSRSEQFEDWSRLRVFLQEQEASAGHPTQNPLGSAAPVPPSCDDEQHLVGRNRRSLPEVPKTTRPTIADQKREMTASLVARLSLSQLYESAVETVSEIMPRGGAPNRDGVTFYLPMTHSPSISTSDRAAIRIQVIEMPSPSLLFTFHAEVLVPSVSTWTSFRGTYTSRLKQTTNRWKFPIYSCDDWRQLTTDLQTLIRSIVKNWPG